MKNALLLTIFILSQAFGQAIYRNKCTDDSTFRTTENKNRFVVVMDENNSVGSPKRESRHAPAVNDFMNEQKQIAEGLGWKTTLRYWS